MKKKILFVIPEYSHGGTNKVLENLLNFLDKKKYDINIFSLYEDGGDYYKNVFAPYIVKKTWLYYFLHDNVFTRKIIGLYNKTTRRDNFIWLYKREARTIQERHKYDTVIAFQEGTSTYFVSYMPINNKIAWIHYDYGNKYWNNNKKNEEGVYKKFERIVCVSNTAKDSFITYYPILKERTVAIHNVLDVNSIIYKSQVSINSPSLDGNFFKIISIGRFAKVKQFEVIPQIASIIKKNCTHPFKWYIIGAGDETKELTMREINKYALGNTVILLGAQDNPYKYIKKCDLLVCTSHSESYPTVINEAKILHVPVLSNNFPSAGEVIDDNCGWICPINSMHNQIIGFISDEDGIFSKVRDAIKAFDYNLENEKILNTLYNLL